MKEIEKLLETEEIAIQQANCQVFSQVLDELTNNPKFPKNIKFTGNETEWNSLDKVLSLKEQYIYSSSHIDLFFSILKKHGYYMQQEIKDAICTIASLEDIFRNNECIKERLKSPYIDDITINLDKKVTIDSDQFGRIEFYQASEYFKNNKDVNYYMKNNPMRSHCHHHTFFFSTLFEDNFAITAQCPYYFYGKYYHSFTYNKEEDKIIDLCSNAVIDKNSYYKIWQPNEITSIKNFDVKEILELVNSLSDQPENRCHLLKVALFCQATNTFKDESLNDEAKILLKKKCLNYPTKEKEEQHEKDYDRYGQCYYGY